MRRIAVLDDDPLYLEMVQQVVQGAGHVCRTHTTGTAFMQEMRRETFDLLIIDWELPDTSGPQVVQWVREQIGKEIPILFITHRSEESDIVAGLGSGADDFMVKPVRMGELSARIHALLRRAYPDGQEDVQEFGPYRFTSSTQSLEFNRQPLELTHREFALAKLLFQNQGRLMSRDHLRDAVWGHSAEVLSRTLDTHISRLRQLMNLRPGQCYTISAIYGYGYRLDARDSPAAPPPPT
ncbi:response regulator transcription factor [Pantoea sp. 18069]|uniref:response regulator transcription factor n=1 Tax=Pantoea sp. 18069 TaxID=2681415 RepID=UPI001359698E|nr:response regulator transcription factor [Pantoea sp. 18069]